MKETYIAASSIERKWYVVDTADYTLGVLASQVAAILQEERTSLLLLLIYGFAAIM